MSLTVTAKDQLVVVSRLPDSWQVFWYSRDGTLLYQVQIDSDHLPKEKDLIAALTNIMPDMQNPLLYLMIHYFRETVDEATKAQSSIENASSRVYKLNLKSGAYESFVELPSNPSRKEKSGFKTTEVAGSPNELIGVSGNGFYYLMGFMDANMYALTILDPAGRVRERRYIVIEDSELTYRDLRLSQTGLLYGLLCDHAKAHVSWWRSDLLLKGD